MRPDVLFKNTTLRFPGWYFICLMVLNCQSCFPPSLPPGSQLLFPQVKPGMTLMGMPFCGWPAGMMSPSLHFPGASPLPSAVGMGIGMAYPSAEGNGNPFLTPSAATSKSESPGPLSDKLPSVPSPAIEVTRPPDHPTPHPIPEGKEAMLAAITLCQFH